LDNISVKYLIIILKYELKVSKISPGIQGLDWLRLAKSSVQWTWRILLPPTWLSPSEQNSVPLLPPWFVGKTVTHNTVYSIPKVHHEEYCVLSGLLVCSMLMTTPDIFKE